MPGWGARGGWVLIHAYGVTKILSGTLAFCFSALPSVVYGRGWLNISLLSFSRTACFSHTGLVTLSHFSFGHLIGMKEM